MEISNFPKTGTVDQRIDTSYKEYLKKVEERISSADISKLIFMADFRSAKKENYLRLDLFDDIFLGSISEDYRQHYNCTACRAFFRNYGWLVTINDDGTLDPVVWPVDLPEGNYFRETNAKIRDIISAAKVAYPFQTKIHSIGTKSSAEHPEFIHFKGYLPLHRRRPSTDELVSSVVSDFIKYSIDTKIPDVKKAINILRNPKVSMRDKYVAIAEEYLEWLQKVSEIKNSTIKHNITFKYLAKSSTLLHTRSSMFGFMLDLIAQDLSDDMIIQMFNEKTDPTVYAKKTAEASYGNLKVANQIIQDMGLESALYRRIAYADEVKAIWRKSEDPVEETDIDKNLGIFGKIDPNKKKNKPEQLWSSRGTCSILDIVDMIPEIKKIYIELRSEYSTMIGGITCPQYEDAGYLIKHSPYGNDDNQFSTYFYTMDPRHLPLVNWNLGLGFHEVNTLCWKPTHWDVELPKKSGFDKYDDTFGIFFLIDGCWDCNKISSTMSVPGIIFDNTIRADIRSQVGRAVYQLTKELPLGGIDDGYNPERPAAFGLCYNGGSISPINLRIKLRDGSNIMVTVNRFK